MHIIHVHTDQSRAVLLWGIFMSSDTASKSQLSFTIYMWLLLLGWSAEIVAWLCSSNLRHMHFSVLQFFPTCCISSALWDNSGNSVANWFKCWRYQLIQELDKEPALVRKCSLVFQEISHCRRTSTTNQHCEQTILLTAFIQIEGNQHRRRVMQRTRKLQQQR